MKIKHRIYLSLLLLSLLPLMFVSVLSERVSHDVLKSVITKDFQDLTKEKALAIGRIIDELIHETRLLASHPDIVEAAREASKHYTELNETQVLENILELDKQWIEQKGSSVKAQEIANNKLSHVLMTIQALQPDVYGETFVTDRLGATLAMTKILSDYYQADEFWWQAGLAHLEDGAFIDDGGYDASAGAIVVGVVAPIVEGNEFIGMLKINFKVNAIIDIVSEEVIESGYSLLLARSDGSFISSSGHQHGDVQYKSILENISHKSSVMVDTKVHGREYLIAAYPMKHAFKTRLDAHGVKGGRGELTDEKYWYVIYEVEQSVVFSPLQKLTNTSLVLGVAAILFAACLGFFLSKSIHRPVVSLMRGAEAIGGGDLGYRIVMKTQDEFGDLANAFNDMTQRLQQTLASQDELNREIEERKRAQESLIRFKSTLDQTMDCVFMFNPETLNFFYVNQGAMSQVGYSHEELLNMTPLNIKPEFDESRFRKLCNELIQGPVHRITFTTVHRHKDGHDTPVEIHLQYINPEDTPPRFLEIVRDITEQCRTEKEKAQLHRYLNELLDAMPSIVVAVDPKINITLWNRQAEMVTGISAAEAIGHPLVERLPMLESHQEQILEAIKGEISLQLERISFLVEKERNYLDVLVYPLVATGIRGTVLRLDDVTEKTRMEDMMVQTEKMLSVGGLAGGMAHELNNPIGGMIQGIQNIRRRLTGGLATNNKAAAQVGIDLDKLQQYLHIREIDQMLDLVSQAGERASGIVNNMLRFSRKSENVRQPVKLEELLTQTVELAAVDYDLKKKYDFRSIEIVYDFAPGLPYLRCIPGEIQQVLINLLRNSAQALSEQPGCKEQAKITLRVRHEDGWFRIEVEDNGPGMDVSTQKRAFEPFYTTKPPGQGTGLGLSVSYYIIHDEHKGSILLESSPGLGTTFTIMLPG